jgi:hypothetical protein
LFDDKSGDEICTQLDRYSRMSECLALFSVEIGSGALMSSRGAGRDLYNTHIAVEKARNLVVDNSYLSGMLLLKKGPNAKAGATPLTVHHPVAYIAEGYEVIPQNMPANVNDFLTLDRFISGLAEIQIGTFLPSSALGMRDQKVTASEINRVAAIENQIREGILMRFTKQYSNAVERMQRGICHPEHIKAASELKTKLDIARQMVPNAVWARADVVDAFDKSVMELPSFMVPFQVPEHLDKDAISCVLNMLERNLPPSDILLMAYSPAEELLPDTQAQNDQILDMMIQRYMGNPNVNQDELLKLDWSRKLGESIANSVILPKDQVESLAIEATRQQIIELQSIIAGQEVPVSPRDNDMVHLSVMSQKLMPLIENAPAGSLPPEMVQPLSKAIEHFMGHVMQAEAKGASREQLSEFRSSAEKAFMHLTAGQGTPMHPSLQPAAAPPAMGGQRAGRVSLGQSREAGNAAEEIPTQFGMVNDVANPPKPPTAG